MGSTTRYQWPYPEESDPPDVPADLSALADAMEETTGAIDDRLTALTGLAQSVFQYTVLTRVSANQQVIPSAVWTALAWDTAQFNKPESAPGFVPQSPTRITCMETGLYRFTGFAGFEKNASGTRALAFRINGNASYTSIISGYPTTEIEWYGSIAVDARLNTNDFVELVARQTYTGSLKIDNVQPRFSLQRLL